MSKYFSYDAIDVNLYVHDTAEEAKQSALDIAEDGYNLSSGWCDGLSKGSQDLIKSICYGVILGGIDLPVRQSSVEQDGADAVAEFKYMVQPPVIVEYEQNNGWIKCSEKMPNDGRAVIAYLPNYKDDPNEIGVFIGWPIEDTVGEIWWEDLGGESYKSTQVTHWRPLPPPPTE